MSVWRALAAACALTLLGGTLAPGFAWAQHGAPMARTVLTVTTPETPLVDQEGRRFAFQDLRGRVVLVAFIYTSCHHVCPLIFDSVRAVQARARAEGRRDIAAVFVTVDPEIDTPEILKAYASRRDADLSTTIFLTGSGGDLQTVWDTFGLKIKRLGRGLVEHPPLTFLADARGVVRYRYAGAILDSEAVLADLRGIERTALKD
ncbi:MAG: SCO family protein [Betaproteobacteria bacterium]|nr:MAG: SCO family protein [Betaproteobacteria bacterium]